MRVRENIKCVIIAAGDWYVLNYNQSILRQGILKP